MANGRILVYASAAGQAAPLKDIRVTVWDESGRMLQNLVCDETGAAATAPLSAPDRAYSLQQNSTVQPYAVYHLQAEGSGWQTVQLRGVQVFDGQDTVARLSLLPQGEAVPADAESASVITIPPHSLFAGGGGSGPAPEELQPGNVLNEVVVPKKITVHLGRPSANVRNVTVSFQSYIANVASSEVYPTWETATCHAKTASAAQFAAGSAAAGTRPQLAATQRQRCG